MVGFCGALDFDGRSVKFSVLKKMCGLHSAGCAFIKDEFGILCDGYGGCEPLTVSYNNSLYTAALIADGEKNLGEKELLQGYFEEGEDFFRSLDFPFSLALYDGRCGELTLAKGAWGDKPLFYTVRDGVVYFASALRPLIRLHGGCVRVSLDVLAEYIDSPYRCIPDGLFCDIHPIKGASALVCSSFGQSLVPLELGTHTRVRYEGEFEEMSCGDGDIRHKLMEALFAFDYPQFDCFMPSICARLAESKASGEKALRIYDGIPETYADYIAERGERLGAVWGIELCTRCAERQPRSKRELRKMEKELDRVLDTYSARGIIKSIYQKIPYNKISEEKNIAMRIRKKGLLCQSAMWFESFNLVLV